MIFMLVGPSGVGKTTISKQLEKYFKIKSLTTDKIRRLKSFETEYKKYRQAGVNFPTSFRKKTYAKLLELGETEILRGKSIIFDATFSRDWQRSLVKDLAKKMKMQLVSIEVRLDKLSKDKIIKRFKDRLKKDKKAALPENYFIYKKYYQAMAKPNFVIDNDGTLAELRKKVNTIIKKMK